MIPVALPWLGDPEAEAVRRVLDTGWITQGPEVAAFEKEFAKFVGAPHAVAVSNCTTALHLALKAAGVGPGDEVVTVSHSFIATANSVRYCGAIPVFVDIEPGTFNMAPEKIESVLTSRTRAILCVHQLGMPCDLERIVALARSKGLPVVEDAACAIGSEIRWQGEWEKIGKPQGDAASFSFHPRKLLTTGDGGMITTRHPDWDRKFRLWRQHGMNLSDTARHQARRIQFEQYEQLGYNYRLTDVQAAIGRVQLGRIPEMVARRRKLAARYARLLSCIEGVGLPMEPEWARTNWQSYCIRLPDGCDQLGVMQYLLDRGVSARRGVMNAHQEPAYGGQDWSCGRAKRDCSCPVGTCQRLAESEKAKVRCIILPLFHAMTEVQQDQVAEALAQALR